MVLLEAIETVEGFHFLFGKGLIAPRPEQVLQLPAPPRLLLSALRPIKTSTLSWVGGFSSSRISPFSKVPRIVVMLPPSCRATSPRRAISRFPRRAPESTIFSVCSLPRLDLCPTSGTNGSGEPSHRRGFGRAPAPRGEAERADAGGCYGVEAPDPSRRCRLHGLGPWYRAAPPG